MEVALTGEKTADNVIQGQAVLNLDDGSGKGICNLRTDVFVVVLAWVQSSSEGVRLSETSNLCSGNQILDVGGNLISSGSFVNSFSMAYAQSEQVLKVTTSVNATVHENGLMASGATSMNDGAGNSSSCKEISAGIIATMVPNVGFELMEVEFNEPSGTESKTVTFENEVSEAIAILKSADIAFPHADNIATVYSGLMLYNGTNLPAISINPGNKKEVTIVTECALYEILDDLTSTTNQVIMLVIAKTAAGLESNY
jgi:hypothetical protein